MTHTRQMHDDEGDFSEWRDHPQRCNQIVEATGLLCGHPVQIREWDSHDGAFTDYQYRCVGGGHLWWIDGIDS